jgi:small subunit ribosomal protein S9
MEKEPAKKIAKPAPPHVPREHRKAAASAAHPAAANAATHPAHVAPKIVAPAIHYTEATGRRKTAVARVRIMAGNGKMTVNDKDVKSYFSLSRQVAAAMAPLKELQLGDFDVSVHVSGGGINAQSEAIRHGLSRAIILIDPQWKPRLRAMGYVTRDSRMVERKKYGLRKARRAPQWAKR